MDLEVHLSVMLSEMSQLAKRILYNFTHIWNKKMNKLMEADNRSVVTRGERAGIVKWVKEVNCVATERN